MAMIESAWMQVPWDFGASPNALVPKKHVGKQIRVLKPNRAWYQAFKKTICCIDCGRSFEDCPGIIHFHHINGHKSANIASMMVEGHSQEEVKEEIQKCIPLCANCHIKRHHEEGR
jgi:hypothetical protein